ncbi:hypothetical protein Q4502_01970 [Mesomycoplasma ovipneumoniae]|uniref:hypothetical protein n=1 Tax=Mesomycoplasma ovipneumoniae TaxID=29562 RepID=UPI0026E27DFB|nr:hypothetical protein [Mesomycoplasma ovipneumoniae]MDO6856469.1 hypothetical protein [Mesomycoplasma ovipneumoniae]
MKFNIDKEFREKEVWYQLDQLSHPDLIESKYILYKSRYDSQNLISRDRIDVLSADYKQELAKIWINNPYAYFRRVNGKNFVSDLNPFNERGNDATGSKYLKKEIERLTEDERVKWIKRLGKSAGTLDGKFQGEWIETEKLQWILSKQEKQSYWLDAEMKDLEEGKRGHISPSEKRELKRYKKFKENNENLSWTERLRRETDEIDKSKWVRIYYSDSKIPPMQIDGLAKDSSEALHQILYYNISIYINVWSDPYEIFSVHEPKSNFNLVNSLLNKYWKNFPNMHSKEGMKRKDAFRDFWDNVKSGYFKDPEVEMLGFQRYPELKQEVESKKDDLEQSQKFEAPKMKM